MKPIEFLDLSDVMQIHVDQINRYGGTPEIRSAELLESSIEQPRATFGGSHLHAFPFEMAAAYLFHIVMNHPFVDGNKRTGTVAALVFLDWNGITFEARPGELSDLTLAVTQAQSVNVRSPSSLRLIARDNLRAACLLVRSHRDR